MSQPIAYLDYNATAPLRPEAKQAMLNAWELPLNASSVHRYGAEAKKRLESARKTIADSLSVFPNEIIFTASGTEANTMVLRGFARPILTSSTEHASVAQTGAQLGAAHVRVDASGILNLAELDEKLKALGTPALVSVILANNETGVIQPLREVADIVHAHGGLLHADAVQAFGKIPLDMGLLGADMLTISAHKVGGPVGVAALVLRNDLPIKPLLLGGRQELGRRASTESIALIQGFAAIAALGAGTTESKRLASLQTQFESAIGHAHVVAQASPRLPNTSMCIMPHVSSETQLMHFDLSGICISAGSACASGRIEPSHVLQAMGISRKEAGNAIRFSVGWATTEAEVMLAASVWQALHAKLSSKHAA